ncbi:MAG TPA: ABC transporter ATP-binding protein [Bacteroidetes bacterium]|nr:ABC transporter ATP-binding protein [Bacteroidota bacterium]
MKKINRILGYITPYWGYAVLNVIFNLLAACFSLFSFTMVVPFLKILFEQDLTGIVRPGSFTFTADYLHQVLNYNIARLIEWKGSENALLIVSLFVVVTFFLKNLFKFLANYFMAPIRTGAVKDMRNTIYDKILRLPMSYYTDARKGDVISRISTDVQEIEVSIISSLEMIFQDPITILIYLTYMMTSSVPLTLFALVLLPLSGWVIGKVGKSLRTTSFRGQRKLGMIVSIIEETLSGLRIIKAFNGEEKMTEKFRDVNNFYTRIMNKVHRRRYLASPASEFLATLVLMILMWYGGTLVLKGAGGLNSEAFIAYLVVFSQIITPAKSISTAYFNLQKGLASAERIDQVLDAPVTIFNKPDARRIRTFRSSIEFRDVSFRYDKEWVLLHIDLTIPKGKTVALVGKSGAGKTTLVDLIPRFIDPQEGVVLIDGIPISDYRIEDLRHMMGIVSQQSILFNDTFYNNIAFGVDNATEEDVIAAAKVANAHDFIMETPMGYFTNVGEGGSKLSGGQQQRISIARAVLSNPPILILDEATSALDTESERLVQDAIVNLMKNRTSIVIAHRLSTIKNADEIVVLEQGRIVEKGSHRDLIGKDGIYRKLHELQIR